MSSQNCIKMPETIKQLLNGKSKSIVFYQKSDLTIERNFGNGYLVLTEAHLIAISENHITTELALKSVKNVRVEELTGGGRITAETETGIRHLIYYSNHMVPYFSDAVNLISDYLENGSVNGFQQNYHTFCKKCGSPLPERGLKCPKCTPKFIILSKIISLALPYKLQVAALMAIMALGILFQVLPPYITKKIVDEVITDGKHEHLYFYIGSMILIGIKTQRETKPKSQL